MGVCVGMAVGTKMAAGSGGSGVRVSRVVAVGGTGVGMGSSEQAAARNSTAKINKKARKPTPRRTGRPGVRFLARYNRAGSWGQYRGDRMPLSRGG